MITRTTTRAAVLVVAVVLLASCSGSDDQATTPTTDPSPTATAPTTTTPFAAESFTGEGEFYAVPDPLPGTRHGQLLRYQVVKPSTSDGATTYRVMYRSESVEGDPIAVTGTVLVPDSPAPVSGRRLLTLAHGTTGIADSCAPSKVPGSELFLVGPAVRDGWLIAMSDYEGLGTPGRHPYLVGESEGRSVIDAILAAGELPDADPGSDLAIAGYSQGGHGALWANQVAGAWAPDLHVVGTFAGAPATEMDVILAAAPSLPVLSGFAYLIVAGFQAAYPDADPSQYLTDAGMARLDEVDKGCVADVIKAFAGSKDLVRPGAMSSGPWLDLAKENNPGNVKTAAPILIIHSQGDEVVPVALSELLLTRLCTKDQVVERRVVDRGGHGATAPSAYDDGLDWLRDRFDGADGVVNTCTEG